MTSEFAIAVHGLVFLNHKQQFVSSEVLAENICTNPVRVRKVMAKIKKAGLITTKEGIEGGYFFHLDPSRLSLRQISDALGIKFVSSSWQSGNLNMPCLISSGMGNVMNDLYQQLNAHCNDYLEKITILDIDQKLFQSKQF